LRHFLLLLIFFHYSPPLLITFRAIDAAFATPPLLLPLRH